MTKTTVPEGQHSVLIQEQPAAWLLALYLAINGGDAPSPAIPTAEQQSAAALHLIAGVASLIAGPAAGEIRTVVETAYRSLPPFAHLGPAADAATIASRLSGMGIKPASEEMRGEGGRVSPASVVCYGTPTGIRCVNVPVHVLE
jgi:hypothetical protein